MLDGQEGVDEIAIFGDDDAGLLKGKAIDGGVGGGVLLGQVFGMEGVVDCGLQKSSETIGQLGID